MGADGAMTARAQIIWEHIKASAQIQRFHYHGLYFEAEWCTPAQLKPDQLRTALPDTHVGVAAGRMLESRVHRLWIVNSHDKLVGVVSMTDVLALLEPAAA
nr:hypothetical protein HK105_005618 [Polyrhizophydium stewartii]